MIHTIMKLYMATSNGDFNGEVDSNDLGEVVWELNEGGQEYVIITRRELSVEEYKQICDILDKK